MSSSARRSDMRERSDRGGDVTENHAGTDGNGRITAEFGQTGGARAPVDGTARPLDADLRHPSLAHRLRLDRPDRPAHRARDHDRRQPQGRVHDSRVGVAEGNRPDRVEVRVGAGRCAQPRLCGARRREAEHAPAQAGDQRSDRRPKARSSSRRRTRSGSRASATPSAPTRSRTTSASPMPRRSSTSRSSRRTATKSSPSRMPCARRSSPRA